jgi:hypothetical protein
MVELPELPFQSQFSDECIANMKAHGGPQLKGGYRQRALDLGLGWMVIYDAWDDAKVVPVDGGAMQITEFDRRFLDAFIAEYGSVPSAHRAAAKHLGMDLRRRDAVWIASPVALYYVAPHLRSAERMEWARLSIREIKTGRVSSRVGLRPEQSDHEIEARLSADGSANLRAIASFYNPRPSELEGRGA